MLTNILTDCLFESIDLFTHLFMFDTFLTRRWSKVKSNFTIFAVYLLLVCYVDIFYFDIRNTIFINFLSLFCFFFYKNKFINLFSISILIRILCLATESLVIATTVPILKFRVLIDIDDNFLFSSIIVLSRTAIILPIFTLVRKIKRGISIKEMIKKISLKQSLFYCLSFFLYIILSYISIWRTEKFQQISNYPLLFAFSFALLGFLLMSCNCISKIIKIRIKEDRADVLSSQIDYQNEQAKSLKQTDKETKKLRHDMKSRLITSLYNVRSGELERAADDLEELLHEVVKSTPRSFSENTAADAVFRHYYALALERGISMKINVILPEREFMPPDDLGLILSHSCENAIEACEGLENPSIEIKTYVHVNGHWFYSIRNSVKERVEIIENHIPTTKEDKTSHGFGLPGIRAAVEKYGGVLTVDCDEQYFTLEISLKVPDKIYEEAK